MNSQPKNLEFRKNPYPVCNKNLGSGIRIWASLLENLPKQPTQLHRLHRIKSFTINFIESEKCAV